MKSSGSNQAARRDGLGQGGRVNWQGRVLQGITGHDRASQMGDMAYIGAVVDGKSQVMPCVQVSASLSRYLVAVCIRNPRYVRPSCAVTLRRMRLGWRTGQRCNPL